MNSGQGWNCPTNRPRDLGLVAGVPRDPFGHVKIDKINPGD